MKQIIRRLLAQFQCMNPSVSEIAEIPVFERGKRSRQSDREFFRDPRCKQTIETFALLSAPKEKKGRPSPRTAGLSMKKTQAETGTSLSGISIRCSDKVKCICEVNYYCIPYFLFHPARKETASKETPLYLGNK